VRVEVGGRDPDPGALRGHLALGGANVRTPAQKLRGNPDGDLRGRLGDRFRVAQQVPQVSGRHPEQEAERVLRLPDSRLELGDLRLGVAQEGLGLLHVQLADRSVAEADVGDLVAPLLNLHVLPDGQEALLEGADLHVGGGYLGHEGDQHVVVARDRRQQARVGRLDPAPEPAPEVELPGRVEAGAPLAEVAVRCGNRRLLAQGDPVGRARSLLQLRIQLSDRDPARGLSLQHPDPGDPQRQVLLVGPLDEGIEHRIVEHGPPGAVVRRLALELGLVQLHPLRGERRRRLLVVRPDQRKAPGEEQSRDDRSRPKARGTRRAPGRCRHRAVHELRLRIRLEAITGVNPVRSAPARSGAIRAGRVSER
jgi:hypothetical protein